MARAKRRSALTMFAIGAVLLLAGVVWAASYWGHGVSGGIPPTRGGSRARPDLRDT
jgi:hypothetical protein